MMKKTIEIKGIYKGTLKGKSEKGKAWQRINFVDTENYDNWGVFTDDEFNPENLKNVDVGDEIDIMLSVSPSYRGVSVNVLEITPIV